MFNRVPILFFIFFWLGPKCYLDPVINQDCQKYYNQQLKKHVYSQVETEPQFPGGAAAYQRFLNRNLRITLEIIDSDEIQWASMSRVKFIVDTDGQIINPIVHDKKDTTQLNPFEKEVLRLVRLMPKWEPGICHGKKVAAEVNRPLIMCVLLETE